MHRIEGHHFASRFAPTPGGGKQWIHIGDPVEIVGLPTEKGGFRYRKKGLFPPWGKERRRQHKMITTIWCMFDSP